MAEKLERVTETLSVYQEKGVFCYGTDAMLLSAYASSGVKPSGNCRGIELCSGTGFVALSMLDRFPNLSFSAVEINEHACRLSEKSAAVSGLSDRFSVCCGDICKIRESFLSERFDFAVCNPPYMTADCGKMCADDYKTIARHEILCKLNDVFCAASYLLGTGGKLYLVYRPDRMASLFAAAEKNHFQIKRMQLVFSHTNEPPKLLLCEAVKQGREGLKLAPPFVVYADDGSYTDEMKRVYEKGEIRFGK